MKYNYSKIITLSLASGFSALATAGTEFSPIEPVELTADGSLGNFSEWWRDKPGIIYKNAENPYIQQFRIEGRFQWQTGAVTGEGIGGGEFADTITEFRRARIGVDAKFLQYFGVKYQINLIDDQRSTSNGEGVDFGFQSIDEAFITFDLAKAANLTNFDSLSLAFGRQKFVIGHEVSLSSKEILTIERSAVANRIFGSGRPTGLTVKGTTGAIDFATSIYSSSVDGDNEQINSFNDSYIFLNRFGYRINEQVRVNADFTYNFADQDGSEDSLVDYRWATSFGAQYDTDLYGINSEFIIGDNGSQQLAGRRGAFWGTVFTPYIWLKKDRLQLVGQYQYQGSDDSEGVRINSRNGNREASVDINDGRGDSHHSFYTGLNYFIIGDNAKVQAGVEYQTVDAPGGSFNTTSYTVAFRTFF